MVVSMQVFKQSDFFRSVSIYIYIYRESEVSRCNTCHAWWHIHNYLHVAMGFSSCRLCVITNTQWTNGVMVTLVVCTMDVAMGARNAWYSHTYTHIAMNVSSCKLRNTKSI